MAQLTLGRQRINLSQCTTVAELAAAMQQIIEPLGNPGPAYPGDTIYNNVYYDESSEHLVTNVGGTVNNISTIIVESLLSPGCGIEFSEGGMISVAVDNTTIICEGGVLKATGTTAFPTLLAGDGIEITGGDTINVDLATDPALEFTGGDLRVKVKTDGGLERTADGLQDKWRYHRATCLSTADYHGVSGDISVDSASSVNGEDVGSTLTARGSLSIYADNNCPLELVFNNDGATDDTDSWSYETAANLRELLAGFDDYDKEQDIALGHQANKTESGHQQTNWWRLASVVLGAATTSVSGGSFAINAIELLNGYDPRVDPESSVETINIDNPFGWNIDNGGTVLAMKKSDGTWIAIQAECAES